MATPLSASIPLKDLPRVIRRDQREFLAAGKRGTRKAVRAGAKIVRDNAPKAFGDLRSSVHADGDSIIVDAPHAVAVEVGSQPHTVPLEQLIAWVKLRGMQGIRGAGRYVGSSTKRQALRVRDQLKSMESNGSLDIDAPERIARAIQKAIQENGTAPHWFAAHSVPELRDDLEAHMNIALAQALSGMGRPL